ncbi:MAG: hypothetical protein AAGF74_09360 [Pseudomonadota bacterium]
MMQATPKDFARTRVLPEFVGPYSDWPRRPRRKWKFPATIAASAVTMTVFVHCVVPMIA